MTDAFDQEKADLTGMKDIKDLKKAQKAGTISEDAEKEAEDEVQKLTDKKVKDVDAIVAAKEKDILTV